MQATGINRQVNYSAYEYLLCRYYYEREVRDFCILNKSSIHVKENIKISKPHVIPLVL